MFKAVFKGIVTGGMALFLALAFMSEERFGLWITQIFDQVAASTDGTLDFTAYVPYIKIANGWIPLNVFLGGLIGFVQFFVLYILIKYTLKLVPFIG